MARTYRGVARTRARSAGYARTVARAAKLGVDPAARPAVLRREVRAAGGAR